MSESPASAEWIEHGSRSPKLGLSKPKRALRLLISVLDPRVYMHAVKLLNYYNYTHVAPGRQLTIGPKAAISPNVSFANAQNIVIGANAHLGARAHLWAGIGAGKIIAKDNLLLGPGVMIVATNYRFNDGSPVTEQDLEESEISIGNDVWIGTNAMLLPGSKIGDNAIIAAGAVVRTAVPANAIMAGVPARQVGTRQQVQTVYSRE